MITIIQNVIVGIVVVAATFWLLRRMYRTVRSAVGRESRCGSCGHCPQSAGDRSPTVVLLNSPRDLGIPRDLNSPRDSNRTQSNSN